MSSRPRARASGPGHPARVLAWLTVLLLASGVVRLLVVCVGPHAAPRIEVAHAPGHCGCTHESRAGAAHRVESCAGGDALAHDHGGCVDHTLELIPWTRPETEAPAPAPAEDLAVPAAWPPPPPSWRQPCQGRLGPAPPRGPGPRLGRTIVLLI